MTVTTAAPVSAATFPGDLIRPWYPAGHIGHIFIDCERLLFWESEPDPEGGPGWLDPARSDTCADCKRRHKNGGAQ